MPTHKLLKSWISNWSSLIMVIGVVIALVDIAIMIYWGAVCIWAAGQEAETLSLILDSGFHFASTFAIFWMLDYVYKAVYKGAKKVTIWLLMAWQWLLIMGLLPNIFILVREYARSKDIDNHDLRHGAQGLAVLIVIIGSIQWFFGTAVSFGLLTGYMMEGKKKKKTNV